MGACEAKSVAKTQEIAVGIPPTPSSSPSPSDSSPGALNGELGDLKLEEKPAVRKKPTEVSDGVIGPENSGSMETGVLKRDYGAVEKDPDSPEGKEAKGERPPLHRHKKQTMQSLCTRIEQKLKSTSQLRSSDETTFWRPTGLAGTQQDIWMTGDAIVKTSDLGALIEDFGDMKLEKKPVVEKKPMEGGGGGVIGQESGGSEESGVLERDCGVVEKDLDSLEEGKEAKEERPQFLQRPGGPVCSFYMKTGTCRFGFSCKFNHPPRRKIKVKPKKLPEAVQTSDLEALNGEFGDLKLEEKLAVEKKPLEEGGDVIGLESSESEDSGILERDHDVVDKDVDSLEEEKEGKGERPQFLQRPGRPVCAFYMKTGTCRFGFSCKFNHPPRRTTKVKSNTLSEAAVQVDEKEEEAPLERLGRTEQEAVEERKDETLSEKVEQTGSKIAKENGKEIHSEGDEQMMCKYYSMPGGCKFGKSCKYIHQEGISQVGQVELNFLGLPIRPGERECPYYMRTGSCKFSTNCKFHHPDPTVVCGQDPPSGYQNGGYPQPHVSGVSQLPVTYWPVQRTKNESVSFLDGSPSCVPGMVIPPHGLHPNPEWNEYQALANPLFLPEIHLQHSSATATTHVRADIPVHQQADINEHPERPGQPECQYFMKNGVCKFKSACKFHHPKTRIPVTSAAVLRPVGLPLKPDQPVCIHYSRFGICKFGPACKFDHPMGQVLQHQQL